MKQIVQHNKINFNGTATHFPIFSHCGYCTVFILSLIPANVMRNTEIIIIFKFELNRGSIWRLAIWRCQHKRPEISLGGFMCFFFLFKISIEIGSVNTPNGQRNRITKLKQTKKHRIRFDSRFPSFIFVFSLVGLRKMSMNSLFPAFFSVLFIQLGLLAQTWFNNKLFDTSCLLTRDIDTWTLDTERITKQIDRTSGKTANQFNDSEFSKQRIHLIHK